MAITFSKSELSRLKEKAESFFTEQEQAENLCYKVCQYLTRNKPPAYFADIIETRDGLMETYIKDKNGDPRSPINHRINGLFFSSFMDRITGLPPRSSPFGNIRLNVIPSLMLQRNVILYFADFYCLNKKNPPDYHYVTVVACEEGTEANRYCSKYLIPLNRVNNRFLMTSDGKNWIVATGRNVIVEVFYTSNINIPSWIKEGATWDIVKTTNSGQSKPNGIPKNPLCEICNISIHSSASGDMSEDSMYHGHV